MSLSFIILLVVLGVVLLLVEFLIIPGVTVAGVAGFVFLIVGVVLSYIYLGPRQGNIVLLVTLVINVTSIFIFFRTKTWRKAGLKSEIQGKVNVIESDITEGISGKSISRLAPTGKALFNDKMIEVQSIEGFIDQNIEIVITSIKNNKIYIKRK
jgi:membrane-bound ClpP family serine protease